MRTTSLVAVLLLAGALQANYTTQNIAKDNASLDISATGTNRTGQFVEFAFSCGFAPQDEGKIDDVPIGFTFQFFGNSYTTLDISANSFLSFDEINTATYFSINHNPCNPAAPNNFIAVCANDHGFPGPSIGMHAVFTQTLGTAPNREFRVQFKNWVAVVGSDPVDWICRLFETTNVIEVHAIVGTGGTLSNGRIVCGLENATGTISIPSPDGWTQGQYPSNAWRYTPATGPEIAVYKPDGVETFTSFQDEMGDPTEGVAFTRTYTIRNLGTATLNITGNVNFPTPTNCTLQVLSQPAVTALAPGASTTFAVEVTPTSAAGGGFFLGTFRIPSNDSNENPFNILIGGTAMASTVPDLHIDAAPGILLAYDALAGGRLMHDFVRLATGQTYQFTYTIKNTSAGTLTFTNNPPAQIGVSGATATILSQPPGSIAGYGSATLTFSITPTGGDIFGGISLPNNDPDSDEGAWGNILLGSGQSPMACEIAIQRPAGTTINSGGNDPFGTVAAGVPIARTYTIVNSGTDGIVLTGTPIVEFDQISGCTIQLTAAPPQYISLGGSETFDVTVTPANGAFTARIIVRNNDADENPYIINVGGTGSAPPEIDIQRPAGTSIADGGTDTPTGVLAGTPVTLTYTILNTGTGTLTLTGTSPVSTTNAVNINGAVLVTQPASLSIAAAGQTTFSVEFTVLASGTFSLELDIASNDADEANYDILITGTASEADIDVRNPAGTSLTNGGGDTLSGVTATITSSVTYQIHSTGGVTLTLTGASPVSVTNTSNITGSVAITQPTVLVLTPGASVPVTLQFTVTTDAAFSFDVTVASDDPNENPFTFTVNGVAASPAPEAEVRRTGAVVNHLGVDALGSGYSGGASFTVTYTVHNLGTTALVLSGTPDPVAVTGTTSCLAVVSLQPTASIAPGASETFEVTVTPSSLGGGFSFTLEIANNDANENPYTWSVTGTATSILGGGGGGGGGSGGGGCVAAGGGLLPTLLLLPLLWRRRRTASAR